MNSKFNNIFIFFKCLLYASRRGSAKTVPKEIKTAVVAALAQLGDTVCTTPVFHALKEHRPDIKLTVISKAPYRDLLAHNTDIDEFIPRHVDPQKTIHELRSRSFDVGFLTTPSFIGLATLYLGGVRMIVAPSISGGFTPQETFMYRLLRRMTVSCTYDFHGYAPREMLHLLEPIGIHATDTTKRLAFGSEAREWADRFIKENTVPGRLVIGLSVSSGNKIKNWPGERFARVVKHLQEKYQANVILFSSPIDNEEVGEFLRHMDASRVFQVNNINLEQLKALMSRLDMYVAVDTGPIYIAEAFGVPTIDIVGPVAEKEQPPIGPKHRIVKINREAPALHIFNARIYDTKEARRQIDEITAEMVIMEIESLINIINK